MTPEEIVAEFPQVTFAYVHASLTYYHNNRGLLEQQDRDVAEQVEKLTAACPRKRASCDLASAF